MKRIIDKLLKLDKTISTMESCTGWALANSITNVENSSMIFKFWLVTYSNEAKMKFGVKKEIITRYSVYSIEVAREMSKNISKFADSDYGVWITGKLNRIDINNPRGEDNEVFVSIYDRENDKYNDIKLEVPFNNRAENKEFVVKKVIEELLRIM